RYIHSLIRRQRHFFIRHTVARWVTGARGLVARRAGVVLTVAAFDVADGRVTRIWAVRNPEKLRRWTDRA
ncbi:hypothetical protein ACFWIS_33485, partial [Kitasatospora sp. NPDC127060]